LLLGSQVLVILRLILFDVNIRITVIIDAVMLESDKYDNRITR